jgi:ABC-type polysaccharide/polyol phosphate export permease
VYYTYLQNLFKNFDIIFSLAKFEYILRFRRTKLGVFWNILSIILTVFLMSIIWSTIFKLSIYDYLPKLLFGFTIYNFVTSNITTSLELFAGKHSHDIQHLNTNRSIYVFRNIFVNIIDYLTYFIIFIFIFIFFDINLNKYSLLFFLGFFLIIFNSIWIAFFLSFLGARFRDITPLAKVIVGVGMMLTPVLWDKSMLGEYALYAYINPLTFFVESVKYPLMGINPGILPFLGLAIFLILGNIITKIFVDKNYKKLPFWVN